MVQNILFFLPDLESTDVTLLVFMILANTKPNEQSVLKTLNKVLEGIKKGTAYSQGLEVLIHAC